MLVTLQSALASDRLGAWLTRQGLAFRPVQGGRALLIADPYVPHTVRQALAADPDVAFLDDTTELPQRVLRQSAADAPMPWSLGRVPVIAGPCSVESRELAFETAAFVAGLGLGWIRGGTDKTRTRAKDFQGHGLRAAEWLREAADAHGLLCVTEVTDTPEAEAIAELVDLIQIGARHMHAPHHLRRIGRLGKPVLLKRGLSASPDEWLWAADYLLEAGAPSVLFCERGIRTPNPLKRFTLDLGTVPFIRAMTPFPILVDPSHAAGSSPYVAPLARAAIAAGAHGVVVECHPDPARACSDKTQALDFPALAALVAELGRYLPPSEDGPAAPVLPDVTPKGHQGGLEGPDPLRVPLPAGRASRDV
jgi:3-deoxy-7-phosphoheptulonate synthase